MAKFNKILIANRGEIACRIIRTASELGIATVGVYSQIDANALHVEMADEAYLVGPAPAADSYLVAENILEVAKKAGADAIHPGYGFLSENAEFAEACEKSGIKFIGPSAKAIRQMGLKDEAKRLMEKAGVPVVPGYHGKEQEETMLLDAAQDIGFPLLIKAVAGGGGKGMRLLTSEKDFVAALASARREANSAFGEDRVLIEKYIERPRHIEVQVFGDSHGNVVHLFERDCSLQRRYQKIIEEAPAPGMSDGLRQKMCDAAVKAAKAIDYCGAGTIEFIVDAAKPLGDDSAFYFMEMNTRLQVEHPVSEMITGTDLVAWQIKVAEGDPLPLAQDQITLSGHAIEVRLYAEDPANDFLPQSGKLIYFETYDGDGARIDTGVETGDEISIHYDPMIAKISFHGDDRSAAINGLVDSLKSTFIAGIPTNQSFLVAALEHKAFKSGAIHTGFIDQHISDLTGISAELISSSIVPIVLAAQMRDLMRSDWLRQDNSHSSWEMVKGWRLNLPPEMPEVVFDVGGKTHRIRASYPQRLSLETSYRDVRMAIEFENGDQQIFEGSLSDLGPLETEWDGNRLYLMREGASLPVDFHDAHHMGGEDEGTLGPGGVSAPMPGKIMEIMVKNGDVVEQDQTLIIMEAMKMEYTLTAPRAGTIADLAIAAGDQVGDGAPLLNIEDSTQ
jgi:3-methylcrotonyl-CoA carboxylase alpha subunit